jgi:hypothetical protein
VAIAGEASERGTRRIQRDLPIAVNGQQPCREKIERAFEGRRERRLRLLERGESWQ